MTFEDAEVEDDTFRKRKKIDWEICGLESWNREKKVLKIDSLSNDARKKCFGCIRVGERDETIYNFPDIAALIETIRKCIAKTDIVALCIHISKKYDKIRQTTEGGYNLPEWPPGLVYEHLRHHNTDPELQAWFCITDMQEIMAVSRNACIEVNPDTGEKRVNPQQLKVFLDTSKTRFQLARLDCSKMMFYANESHLDIKAASQPHIAVSDKTIEDYFAPADKDMI